jgi:hypothetical protein
MRTVVACLVAFGALGAFGCSKKSGVRERRDPWPAESPASAAPASLRTHYAVAERCSLPLELKAREATPKGEFRVCRGELDVDLANLSSTTGRISVDVASLEMENDADGGRSEEWTGQAHDWLDVGSSRPEAERERLRWATFTLSRLDELSADKAAAGKRVRIEPEDGGVEIDSADAAPPAEAREVSFVARGALVLHDVRVELSIQMRARFEYDSGAATPKRIDLVARRPMRIALDTHDIKPRDAKGQFLSEGVKLFGVKVGREARVSATISLFRQGG